MVFVLFARTVLPAMMMFKETFFTAIPTTVAHLKDMFAGVADNHITSVFRALIHWN